jgi:hypothetical protein
MCLVCLLLGYRVVRNTGVAQKYREQRIGEVFMAEGGQQQQQQQQNPAQQLARALQGIRQVQHLLELNSPQQTNAIAALRQAGDLVWAEIERIQQQQR